MAKTKNTVSARNASLKKAHQSSADHYTLRVEEEVVRMRQANLESENAERLVELENVERLLAREQERVANIERDKDELAERYSALASEREILQSECDYLRSENDRLLIRVRDLESEVLDRIEHLQSVSQEKQCLQEELEIRVSEATLAQKDKDQREHQSHLEHVERELELLVAQTPTKGKKLKPYHLIVDRSTKDGRFALVIDLIRTVVSPDGLDSFLFDFVHFVAKSPDFKFRLRLTDRESYYLKIRFGLSDGFLKNLKHILNKTLNFDVIASRKSIERIRSECAPSEFYSIEVETAQRTTKNGRIVDTSSAIARMTHIEKWLIRRLETLHSHGGLVFDAGTGEDIVIAVGGDKGGDTTKLCLILENIPFPNNPHSMTLLGYYSGPDSHQYLREKMGVVFDQLNQLKTVTYRENGIPTTRDVRMKVVGDCKFVSAIFGHGGQSCKDPCFVCHLSWRRSGHVIDTVGSFPFDQTGALRTLAELKLTGDPLLLVEPSSAGPPSIHVLMGIGEKYVVEYLYALCNNLDHKSDVLPVSLKDQRKVLAERSREADMYAARVQGLYDASGLLEAVSSAYEKIEKTGKVKRNGLRTCSSQFCVANMVDKKLISEKLELHLCDNCDQTFHSFCVSLFKPDDILGIRSSFKCLNCSRHSSIADHSAMLRRSRNIIRHALENDEEVLSDVLEERDELDGHLNKNAGPTRKKLEEAFRSIRCDVRVWYQKMNGNQYRELFRQNNIDTVLAIFPKTPELDSLRTIMSELSYIMTQSSNSLKTDSDIDDTELSLLRFSAALRDLHPSASVSPKLHILTAHLIPFMREYGSWGRVTEQGLESTHPTFNSESVRLSPVRSVKLQSELLLKQFLNFNLIADSGDSWLQTTSN